MRAALFVGCGLWLICFNSVDIGVGFGFVLIWFVVCYFVVALCLFGCWGLLLRCRSFC